MIRYILSKTRLQFIVFKCGIVIASHTKQKISKTLLLPSPPSSKIVAAPTNGKDNTLKNTYLAKWLFKAIGGVKPVINVNENISFP